VTPAPVTDARKKAAPAVVGGCAIGLLVGLAAIALGAITYANQERLGERGVRVMARVTDARDLRQGSRETFDLRYAFDVADHPRTFTLGDELGRSDLWATTDGRAEWEKAQQTGQVEVIYMPDDPGINRLASRHGNPLGDAAAVILLGLLVAGVCLRIGWLEATGQGQRWRSVLEQIRKAMRPAP